MDRVEVKIYHTNDMHASISAMSRLSHFIRRLRQADQAAGIVTFYWDAGDAADRNIEVVSLTKGAAFYDVLNAMGIELQASGNDLSMTYGPQVLADCAARADFPILAANLRDGPEGAIVPGLQESTIIEFSPEVKIAVFGLTAPADGIYEVFGYHLPKTIAFTSQLIARLKSEAIQGIVLLSHLGLAEDRLLAEAVDGIDLIVGSHTHDLIPAGEWVNGTLIVQAGEYARCVGCIHLELADETGGIVAARAEVLEVPPDEFPDPIFEAALETANREIAELKNRVIGELESPLETSFFVESRFGNFSADALRSYMQAEIGILMSGLLTGGLPEGKITLGDLNSACFTTANPCRSNLQGRDLKAALEKGLDPSVYSFMHKSFRGSPIGIPQISGIEVRFDPAAKVGMKISKITVGGEYLDPDRSYLVAHTDAEVMPEFGYFDLNQAAGSYSEVPTILPEVLALYLKDPSTSRNAEMGRWYGPE